MCHGEMLCHVLHGLAKPRSILQCQTGISDIHTEGDRPTGCTLEAIALLVPSQEAWYDMITSSLPVAPHHLHTSAYI